MGCCGRKRRGQASMIEKSKSLLLSAANALMHVIKTGQLAATDDVIKVRIDTCKACNDFTGTRCLACGCYIVLKTGIASEKCPKGYWE